MLELSCCTSMFMQYKRYKSEEMFEENFLRMEQDEAYKKEQYELAEADFSE